MIVDSDGNEMSSLSIAGPAASNVAFILRIDCLAGYYLSASSPDPGVVIWGKAAPGDAFQNIQTTPIDLTPFFPAIKTFYFECRIAAGEPAELLAARIVVGR